VIALIQAMAVRGDYKKSANDWHEDVFSGSRNSGIEAFLELLKQHPEFFRRATSDDKGEAAGKAISGDKAASGVKTVPTSVNDPGVNPCPPAGPIRALTPCPPRGRFGRQEFGKRQVVVPGLQAVHTKSGQPEGGHSKPRR
jgi:hypothetical protein